MSPCPYFPISYRVQLAVSSQEEMVKVCINKCKTAATRTPDQSSLVAMKHGGG